MCQSLKATKFTRSNLSCQIFYKDHMSRIVRKPNLCICENKGADQLHGKHGNSAADQRLCFPYIDSAIPLLLKSEIQIKVMCI